ncbi:MAG TPA: hypothetical protein ENI82_04940 [Bacteroidetes bacterium]|nr:hypothetical protein [Bacteroidota bacterium]
MNNIKLPPELLSIVSPEKIDFATKAGRDKPKKKSILIILFGVVWTLFTSIFVFIFFVPIIQGKEVHFESNGVPTVASPDNLEPLLLPAIIVGLFLLIGIGMLSWGIYSMTKKGGYFVGTPTRLIFYQNGIIRSIDWEEFSGDIEISGDNTKGNISLLMRIGKMVSSKNGSDRYVPDVIYITEVPNVYEIEKICRQRIKENDPTPATTYDSE